MKGWKRTVFVNFWGCAGIAVSAIALPESTPFSIWALCSLAALVLLNVVLIRLRKSDEESAEGGRRTPRGTIGILGCLLLLIIDLVWTFWNQHP